MTPKRFFFCLRAVWGMDAGMQLWQRSPELRGGSALHKGGDVMRAVMRCAALRCRARCGGQGAALPPAPAAAPRPSRRGHRFLAFSAVYCLNPLPPLFFF